MSANRAIAKVNEELTRQNSGTEKAVLAWACLVTAMALWGSSFVALKVAILEYPSMTVLWGRMLIGGVCFLMLWPTLRGNHYRAGDWKYLLAMVFFEPCLYFFFEAKALENTTASQAGMVVALLPVLLAVGARLFLSEPILPKTMIGFGVAIGGVIWLTLAGEVRWDAPRPALGNFYEGLAMVCATGYTLLLKHLSSRYNPFFLTALQAWAGTGFYLLLGMTTGGLWPETFRWPPMLCILYLGVVVTIGAYGLYNFGVSRIPANQAGVFTNLIPMFTVIFAWLLLGETLTPQQCVAAVVVLGGVALSQEWPGAEARR